ncbi:hypothetical protein GQ44DRAFT_730136 [Phaeosphaeriaceae sp. PMI808]|nr:hypothetical protein GQ44DRAFT_730136 [Phaeosphaeriaceae sp. PMI808]
MHSIRTMLLYISASLMGSTLALPTTSSVSPLDRRSCQVSYPTKMIDSTPYQNSVSSLEDFCVVSKTRVRYIEFSNIPSSARGACQLEFIFPPSYSIGGPRSHQVNVWKTERSVAEADTWVSAPKVTTLFGTVTLNSQPLQHTRLIVNSGECASMKNFKITLVDTTNSSSITYTQQYPPSGPVAGLRIVRSC